MSAAVVATGDECELLLRFLQRQRAEVLAAGEGLTAGELRWRPHHHLLPIIGIVNHLAFVEWRWIDSVYLGGSAPPARDEYDVAVERDAHGVIEVYEARAQRTDAVVREARDLTSPCLGIDAPDDGEHPLDLRWVMLHLIEETARHAGHADATRMLIDGRSLQD